MKVPLRIARAATAELPAGTSAPAELLRLIYSEERSRYMERMDSATSALERRYVSSVYEQQLVRFLEYSVAPSVRTRARRDGAHEGGGAERVSLDDTHAVSAGRT